MSQAVQFQPLTGSLAVANAATKIIVLVTTGSCLYTSSAGVMNLKNSLQNVAEWSRRHCTEEPRSTGPKVKGPVKDTLDNRCCKCIVFGSMETQTTLCPSLLGPPARGSCGLARLI
jgi:hypothetical protein